MNTFTSFYSTPNPTDSPEFASLVHHFKMTPPQALASLYGTKTIQTTTKKTDKNARRRDEAAKKREEAAIKREEKKAAAAERERAASVAAAAAEIQKKLRQSVPGNIMNIPELKTTTRRSTAAPMHRFTEVMLTRIQKKMLKESKKHEPNKYKTLPCEHHFGKRSPRCKYEHSPLCCPFYHNEQQKQMMELLKKERKSTTKPTL